MRPSLVARLRAGLLFVLAAALAVPPASAQNPPGPSFRDVISLRKERLAAMWHNWQWFARHLWREDVSLPLEK